MTNGTFTVATEDGRTIKLVVNKQRHMIHCPICDRVRWRDEETGNYPCVRCGIETEVKVCYDDPMQVSPIYRMRTFILEDTEVKLVGGIAVLTTTRGQAWIAPDLGLAGPTVKVWKNPDYGYGVTASRTDGYEKTTVDAIPIWTYHRLEVEGWVQEYKVEVTRRHLQTPDEAEADAVILRAQGALHAELQATGISKASDMFLIMDEDECRKEIERRKEIQRHAGQTEEDCV